MLHISAVWQVILIFLSGSSVFSFLNVVIYRAPRHMDIIKASSRCEVCGHTLSFPEMFPVFGWFVLRGRCRYCKAAVSVCYPAIEALGGCAALLCVFRWGISVQALIAFGFLAVLTATAFIDIDTMRIPDGFVLAAGGGRSAVHSVFFDAGFDRAIDRDMQCQYDFVGIRTDFAWRGWGGDIKMTAACGLFLGWKQSLTAFVLAVLFAECYCIFMLSVGKLKRRSKIAFGAFLCFGMAVTLFLVP